MGLLVALRDLLAELVKRGRCGRSPRTWFLDLLRHNAALLIAPYRDGPQKECGSVAPRRWRLLPGAYSADSEPPGSSIGGSPHPSGSARRSSLGPVADRADRAHVRLAELVAALSLGVDLGFGQPMEHMLRQCLIALRLAERVGLDAQRRADVYYTALLVGVGCHSDAHEQAKWFGDDIALKAGKYDHEFHSVRGAAAGMRQLGSGHAGSQRFRVALEFALSGHREVADMINQHAAMTRTLGEQLGLPMQVLDALGAAYETWDGRGWPGKLKGEDRSRSRPASRSWRSSSRSHTAPAGSRRPRVSPASAPAQQFDPELADVICADGRDDPRGPRRRSRPGTR